MVYRFQGLRAEDHLLILLLQLVHVTAYKCRKVGWWLVRSVSAPTPGYTSVHSVQTPPRLLVSGRRLSALPALISSTFCCALAIISSTSGIVMATVGLIVALMTLIRIGRLTSIHQRLAKLSATSAACLCANACSLHIFPMHFLITFTCSFGLPTSSSSTNS